MSEINQLFSPVLINSATPLSEISASPTDGTCESRSLSPTSLLPFGYARSYAEACRANDASKFRQLPCRTFISTGMCPYRDRCVYLHDPRVAQADPNKYRVKRKNREDIVLDSMFWPVMPTEEINKYVDQDGNIAACQMYCIPIPKEDQYRNHDQAIFSLWHHFICYFERSIAAEMRANAISLPATHYQTASKINSHSRHPQTQNGYHLMHEKPGNSSNATNNYYVIREYKDRQCCLALDKSSVVHSHYVNNTFTNRRRLAVFMYLSNGQHVPGREMQSSLLLAVRFASQHAAASKQSEDKTCSHQAIAITASLLSPLTNKVSYPDWSPIRGSNAQHDPVDICLSPSAVSSFHPSPLSHSWSKAEKGFGAKAAGDEEIANLTLFSSEFTYKCLPKPKPIGTKIFNPANQPTRSNANTFRHTNDMMHEIAASMGSGVDDYSLFNTHNFQPHSINCSWQPGQHGHQKTHIMSFPMF